jgi:hypothetical protein
MTDAQSEPEVARALEAADGYLTKAENVLWETAAEINTDEMSEPVEQLTQEVWELQHQLDEIQEELNEQRP